MPNPIIKIYQTESELRHFQEGLTKVKEVEGDLIEVGVFEGGTAKLMADAYPDRNIYLFDTFEGLPDNIRVDKGDSKNYVVGHCKGTLDTAKDYLLMSVRQNGVKVWIDRPNVFFYKGIFPETADPVKDKKFCLAHIDVDLYQGTKDSLEFIYPRMNQGGLIIVHDYPAHPGVKRAVDEFMNDKKDKKEELGSVQDWLRRQLFITKC